MVQEMMIEKAIEAGTGQKVDINTAQESITIQSGDESIAFSSGDNVKVPAAFPNDIYVYNNAQVKMAMDLPEGVSVSFLTNENVAAVRAKYEQEMARNGWSKEMSMDLNGQVIFGFQKQDRASQIMIYEDGEGTLIQITAKK
jgi:purine nucleoside permease